MAGAGRPKTGGRRRGTRDRKPQRMSGRLREHLWAYCEATDANPFEVLVTLMQRTHHEFLQAACAKELAAYLLPKLASVKVQGEADAPLEIVHRYGGADVRPRTTAQSHPNGAQIEPPRAPSRQGASPADDSTTG